jgi:hypothetical protein
MTAFLSHDYTCVGVDPSAEGIAFAKERFPTCMFVQGTAPSDIDKTYALADGILLLEVLEHIENDVAFVHQLIAAMKPGAILFMMAPADMSLWSPHDEGFEHYRRYDLEGFRKTWAGQSMQELLVSHCNARLYPIAKAMRTVSKMRGKAWGPGSTDIALSSKPVNETMKRIFQGETHRLLKALHGRARPYSKGVTLLAVLRKK